jgi:predicted anti-sigma-YlaC factor YlaD
MKTCEAFRIALVDLVFGDIDDAKHASLNEHLLACSECREEESRLLGLRSAARGEPIAPSPEVRARIEALVMRRQRRGALAILGHPVPAYAAILAAIVAAWIVSTIPTRAPQPPSSTPARSAPGVLMVGRGVPFNPAGCYDTRATPVSLVPVMRDSSSRHGPLIQDSL